MASGGKSWSSVARDVADRAFENADRYDADGAYPLDDVAALRGSGLLTAVLPREFGGDGLAGAGTMRRAAPYRFGQPAPWAVVSRATSTRSDLFFGTEPRSRYRSIASEAREGKLSGVWNTDDSEGLRLLPDCRRYRLEGRKILASGAGYIERPLVTATDE